jgi:uncharacterized protein YigE (DUF2233 family)/lysophospholipase L1-like esterase
MFSKKFVLLLILLLVMPLVLAEDLSETRGCDNLKIALLGDSLTHHINSAGAHGSWGSKFKDSCGDGVVNFARSGRNTAWMLKRLDNEASIGGYQEGEMLKQDFEYLVVMGGTNDVTQHNSYEAMIKNLELIYKKASDDGMKVIAMTMPPHTKYAPEGCLTKYDSKEACWKGWVALTEQVNNWIRQQKGVLVHDVVDLFSLVQDSANPMCIASNIAKGGSACKDVHFNDEGYQYISELMQNYFKGGQSSPVSSSITLSKFEDPDVKFVVLPDIHVRLNTGKAKKPFDAFINTIVNEIKPDFIVLVGDMIHGNPVSSVPNSDNYDAIMKNGWGGLETHLKPLRDAGIPYFPVVGNHDYRYTKELAKAYGDYWSKYSLSYSQTPIQISGSFDSHYSFGFEDSYFISMFIPSHRIESSDYKEMYQNELVLLKDELELIDANSDYKNVFVFSHIPIKSACGEGDVIGDDALVEILAASSKFKAFITGHEHVYDDRIIDEKVRQIITGRITNFGSWKYKGKKAADYPASFSIFEVKDELFEPINYNGEGGTAPMSSSVPMSSSPVSAEKELDFLFEDYKSKIWIPGGVSKTENYPLLVLLHGYNKVNADDVGFGTSRDLRPLFKSMIDEKQVKKFLATAPSQISNTEDPSMLWKGFNLYTYLTKVKEELKKEGLNIDESKVILVGDGFAGCNPLGGLVTALESSTPFALGLANICTDDIFPHIKNSLNGVKILNVNEFDSEDRFSDAFISELDLKEEECWADVDASLVRKECYKAESIKSYLGDKIITEDADSIILQVVLKEILLDNLPAQNDPLFYEQLTQAQLSDLLNEGNFVGAIPMYVKAAAILQNYDLNVYDVIKKSLKDYASAVDACIDQGSQMEYCAKTERQKMQMLSSFGLIEKDVQFCMSVQDKLIYDFYSNVKSCANAISENICRCSVDLPNELLFVGDASLSFTNSNSEGLVFSVAGYSSSLPSLKFGYIGNSDLVVEDADSGKLTLSYNNELIGVSLDNVKDDYYTSANRINFVRSGNSLAVVKNGAENSAWAENLPLCEGETGSLQLFCFEDKLHNYAQGLNGFEPLKYKFAVQLGAKAPEPVELEMLDVLFDDEKVILSWVPVPRAARYSIYNSDVAVTGLSSMKKIYPVDNSVLVVYDASLDTDDSGSATFNDVNSQILGGAVKEIKIGFDVSRSCSLVEAEDCLDYDFVPGALYFNSNKYYYLPGSGNYFAVVGEDKDGNYFKSSSVGGSSTSYMAIEHEGETFNVAAIDLEKNTLEVVTTTSIFEDSEMGSCSGFIEEDICVLMKTICNKFTQKKSRVCNAIINGGFFSHGIVVESGSKLADYHPKHKEGALMDAVFYVGGDSNPKIVSVDDFNSIEQEGDVQSALQVGPLFLKDGVYLLEGKEESSDYEWYFKDRIRSVIGLECDGVGSGVSNAVFVHGNRNTLEGGLKKYVTLLKDELKCKNAMAFDGGGSSGFYLPNVDNGRLSRGKRAIPNAVIAVAKETNGIDEAGVQIIEGKPVDDLAPGPVGISNFVYDSSNPAVASISIDLPTSDEDGSDNEDTKLNLDFVFRNMGTYSDFTCDSVDLVGTGAANTHVEFSIDNVISYDVSGDAILMAKLKPHLESMVSGGSNFCFGVVARDESGNLPFGSPEAQEFALNNIDRYKNAIYAYTVVNNNGVLSLG